MIIKLKTDKMIGEPFQTLKLKIEKEKPNKIDAVFGL